MAARAADRLLDDARARDATRWIAYLELLPDHLRDGDLADLRRLAMRARAAYGPKVLDPGLAPGRRDRAVPDRDRQAPQGAGETRGPVGPQ